MELPLLLLGGGTGLSAHWVWDRYWHCDRIASCFDGAGASNYHDCVASGWRDFFAELPAGSRIIDLCTGNGALALIAAQLGREQDKAFAITGVDIADIDPPAYVSRFRDDLGTIRFQPGTPVEELPFPDATFDVAISQYGLEYCELERAVPEMVRVLAPGGRAKLAVHAAEGVVAANAREAAAEADLLLGSFDLIGASRRCFEAVGRVEQGDSSPAAWQAAAAAVAAFKTALRMTGEHVSRANDKVMFHNSGSVMLDAFKARKQVGFDAILAKVDHVEQEILAHRGRCQALVDAALDQEGLNRMTSLLESSGGMEINCEPLVSEDGLIAHVVSARFG